MLNKKRLAEMLAKKSEPNSMTLDDSYNCHGLTCYIMGIETALKWVEPYDFERIIKDNQNRIKPVKSFERLMGEVIGIALEDNRDSHSAIYIGNGQYLQKKGRGPLEVVDFYTIRQTYKGTTIQRLLIK